MILWELVEIELVAQSVEQRTFNAWVVGSNPTELTTKTVLHEGDYLPAGEPPPVVRPGIFVNDKTVTLSKAKDLRFQPFNDDDIP